MILIVFKYLLPRGFRGITIFPFVIFGNEEDRQDAVMVNHERIHIRQQAEMLLVFFYLWYGAEYLVRLLKSGSRREAYRAISFEREAYAHEKDPGYLKKRPFWRFLDYL